MDVKEKTDTRVVKGQATRDRLLAEALRLFALKGFEAVGTRELAAAAGANIAAIAFHFGGKDGLYAEVVRAVARELARRYQEAFGAARAESDAAGEEPLLRASRVVAKLVASLAASNRSQWMSLLLQREFITPTACFDMLYEDAIRPCLEAFSRLVAETSGLDAADLDNKVLAYSLFTMASAFSRNGNFLRFAGKNGYTPQDAEAIGRAVAGFAARGLRTRP